MNPVWKIRPATKKDGPEIASIHTDSIALLNFLPRLHTPEEILAFFTKVVAEETVNVAEYDHSLLGFIGESKNWINHLWIRPDQLRIGIGSALLKCAQFRHPHLKLWCFQKNLRARAFYEGHGFEAVKFTDGANNEEKEPDILYEWRKF